MKPRRALLLLLLCTQLSGCLLTRVYTFKEQFCDYQSNFTLRVDDAGVTLEIHHPVLLDSDVTWLLGAGPTTLGTTNAGIEMVYVVEKDLPRPDSEYAIPLILRFTRHDGDLLLSGGSIDKNLSAMITPGLIEETVAHACDASTSILSKRVEFDLSDLDPDDIPTRDQILDAFGPPRQTVSQAREMAYRFRLQGAGPEVEKSFARVWLGDDGESVERVRFRYLRYELDADFVAGTGTIAVHL